MARGRKRSMNFVQICKKCFDQIRPDWENKSNRSHTCGTGCDVCLSTTTGRELGFYTFDYGGDFNTQEYKVAMKIYAKNKSKKVQNDSI